MKRIALMAVLACFDRSPGAVFAQNENHVEVGGFAQYYRFDQGGSSQINFVGLGGRAGFYVNPWASIEGELSYDFARNQTNFFNNGATTSFVTTRTRPLHGLFGPKFNFGTGNANLFATGKVGFVNFGSSDQSLAQSFGTSMRETPGSRSIPGSAWRVFGGTSACVPKSAMKSTFQEARRNNLKISLGPHFRF